MMGGRWRTLARHFVLPVIGTLMLLSTLLWAAYIGAFPLWMVLMMGCSIAVLIVGILFQEAGGLRDSITSAVYALFVLLAGIGFYLVTTNYSTRIDLTEHKINSLSPQTVNMLRTLDLDVQVTAFAEARNHAGFRNLFDLYAEASPNVRFAVYDPLMASSVAQEFDRQIPPNTAFVVVREDGRELRRHRFVLRHDEPYREHVLSNAIQKTVLGSADRIYFTEGHGERPLRPVETRRREAPDISWQQFSLMIADSILPVEGINLSQRPSVPEDAAALIIASPTIDFNEIERESVLEYINEGGAVFITLDPRFNNPAPMPNLDRILARAGVQMPSAMLMDQNAPRQGNVVVGASPEHPITEDLSGFGFVFDGVRELVIDEEMSEEELPLVQPILATANAVWRLDIDGGSRATRQPDDQELQAGAVGIVSTIPTPTGLRRSNARMAVFGDGDFLANHRMTEAAVANLGLNTVEWMAMPDNVISIPPKTFPPSAFTLDVRRFWTMIGVLLLIGFVMLGGGLSYTLARRRMG